MRHNLIAFSSLTHANDLALRMLRWDSLAKIMVGANGEGLMDELGDTGRTVAEFGPVMFGAEWRPVLGQMGKLSLESAKHFVLEKNDYDSKAAEVALNTEREAQCARSTDTMEKMSSLPLVANKAAETERLKWALPRVESEADACASALASLTDTSATPVW